MCTDRSRQAKWQAFLKRNKLEPLNPETVVVTLRAFLMPVIMAAASNSQYLQQWKTGAEWLLVKSD